MRRVPRLGLVRRAWPVVALWACAGAALAQTMPSRHGAFATDGGTGAWGWAQGFAKPTEAANAALRACRSRDRARGCAVVLRFQDACAAYASDALGDGEAYGAAWGEGVAEVREQALNHCRVRGGRKSDCVVRVSGCAVPDTLPTSRRGSIWNLAPETLVPGRRFRECAACPPMVVVPAGAFTMGSPQREGGRYPDEGPRRTVTIAAPFAVGVTEVTFAQWEACLQADGCGGYRPDDAGYGRGQRPVVNVSRAEAASYLEWLGRKTARAYRLPSEAEWEYAARAGAGTPFHTGDTIAPSQANYDGTSAYGAGVRGAFRGRTLPVGAFAANAFGLRDVHGNVWEWVADCWNDSFQDAPSDGAAWREGDCERRVQRGGSWSNAPKDVRSAVRNWRAAGHKDANSGFRVVREIGA